MIDQWVSFSRRGPVDVIHLTGEIDMSNAADIGRAIAVSAAESGAVLIDLTTVSFLDSAGVRLLDAVVGDLIQAGVPIRLVVGERSAARMTLQLCAFREDLLADDLDRAATELSR